MIQSKMYNQLLSIEEKFILVVQLVKISIFLQIRYNSPSLMSSTVVILTTVE